MGPCQGVSAQTIGYAYQAAEQLTQHTGSRAIVLHTYTSNFALISCRHVFKHRLCRDETTNGFLVT